jgi:hypothetical protein
VPTQCKRREKGTLVPEREAKLDVIGFWQVKKCKWASNFDDSRKSEEDSVADAEPRHVHRAGLDNDEQNKKSVSSDEIGIEG